MPYMANPLEQCEVRSIIWVLELPSRRMAYRSNILCKLGGKKEFTFQDPENLTLEMTYPHSENDDIGRDDMMDYIAFSIFSDQVGVGLPAFTRGPIFRGLQAYSTSAGNVLAVLDGLQRDLFNAVFTELNIRRMNNIFFHST
ncbi:hypothetical protein FRC11_013021, partial [Ceratobasidium sp. 423]